MEKLGEGIGDFVGQKNLFECQGETRNKLVPMLADSTWGAGAKTIRTSALARYSVAE